MPRTSRSMTAAERRPPVHDMTSVLHPIALPHHPSVLERPRRVCEEGGFPWAGRGLGVGGRVAGGIATVAAAIAEDVRGRVPGQHRKQREGLALLTATMLDVRGANPTDLAASLPRAAERPDMRYQWISRLLGNPLIDADAVMAP